MIHANPTRNKQAKTNKENLEDKDIIQNQLVRLNQRHIDADRVSNYAELVRLVWDYRAINCRRLAHQIYMDLPEAYKVLAMETQ